MRVLLVSQYFWPENFRINELVSGMVDKGVEVEVLTGKPNYPDGKIARGYKWWSFQHEHSAGAKIFRVPLIPRGKGGAFRLAVNYLSFVLFASVGGAWLLRGRRYDIVLVYAPSPILQAVPAILISRIKGCPMVLWVQDLWPDSLSATGYVRQARLLGAMRRVVRWIYSRADLLLVQSRAFCSPVSDMAPGKVVLYYPNSVDASFALAPTDDSSVPPEFIWNDGFTVLFAGNVGQAQAVEVIIGAAQRLKRIPNIRFLILGTGSRWGWLREQVAAVGLSNVYLPGRFPSSAMPAFMQRADALLVTLVDQPPFAQTVPNKVQAYMASGRPIIASLNGEGARLVQEANAGLTAPAGDAEALADAILELFHMPEARRNLLGSSARRYYLEHFEHGYLVDVLISHLRETLELSGKA